MSFIGNEVLSTGPHRVHLHLLQYKTQDQTTTKKAIKWHMPNFAYAWARKSNEIRFHESINSANHKTHKAEINRLRPERPASENCGCRVSIRHSADLPPVPFIPSVSSFVVVEVTHTVCEIMSNYAWKERFSVVIFVLIYAGPCLEAKLKVKVGFMAPYANEYLEPIIGWSSSAGAIPIALDLINKEHLLDNVEWRLVTFIQYL